MPVAPWRSSVRSPGSTVPSPKPPTSSRCPWSQTDGDAERIAELTELVEAEYAAERREQVRRPAAGDRGRPPRQWRTRSRLDREPGRIRIAVLTRRDRRHDDRVAFEQLELVLLGGEQAEQRIAVLALLGGRRNSVRVNTVSEAVGVAPSLQAGTLDVEPSSVSYSSVAATISTSAASSASPATMRRRENAGAAPRRRAPVKGTRSRRLARGACRGSGRCPCLGRRRCPSGRSRDPRGSTSRPPSPARRRGPAGTGGVRRHLGHNRRASRRTKRRQTKRCDGSCRQDRPAVLRM